MRDSDVERLIENRYVLRGNHPGLNEIENTVSLTYPIRQTIMLCNRGGFLRRYGKGAWEMVKKIRIGKNNVSYITSGFLVYGEQSHKGVLCEHPRGTYELHLDEA